MGIDDPKLEELVHQWRRALEPDKRKAISADIQRLIAEQLYWVNDGVSFLPGTHQQGEGLSILQSGLSIPGIDMAGQIRANGGRRAMADYERTQAYREKLRNGEFDLGWMQAESEWGVKATPSKRGLTLNDINVGSYGVIPEEVPDSRCFAPRGADFNVAEMPNMGYSLNTRAEAWAENMGTLYEEAVARQWSSTRDIPWHTLQPLPKDIEHAMCQLCTFFTEVEFIAGDVPGWWLSQINAIPRDEAVHGHTDHGRSAPSRSLSQARPGKWGWLGQVSSRGRGGAQVSLTCAHSPRCWRLHLFGEGRVLTLFRQGTHCPERSGKDHLPSVCPGRIMAAGVRLFAIALFDRARPGSH